MQLKVESTNNSNSNSEERDQEILMKIQNKIDEMNSKYDISINEELLEEIEVSEENNPKTIDMYVVKKGGLIPRPAFPSIDFEWVNWE